MFLKQVKKKIQEAKNRLVICNDLRRQLIHIEVHDSWNGIFNTASSLALGLAVIKQIFGFLRERKGQSS